MGIQHGSGGTVGGRPQAQSLPLGGATKIQVAVLQTRFLTDFTGARRGIVYLEWQGGRFVEDVQFGDVKFYITGGKVGVFGTFGALFHHAGDTNTEFAAEMARTLSDIAVAEHNLGDTGTVAQVDKNNAAVVASARNPAS